MLGAMQSPLRASSLRFGFALLFTGCTSGDGPAQTTGPTPSEETADATSDEAGTSNSTNPADSTAGPVTTTSPTTTDDVTTAATMTTTGTGVPQVVMETTLGTLVIELDEVAAPITAENFIAYVEAGFFDGSDGMGATVFHRVIPGFVIQGGGLTEDLVTKATMPPIVNESGNGLFNTRGTISMARTMDPNSATSQFFLNLVDNAFLDDPPGYAVFGTIVSGLEVMDAIAAVEVDRNDVPLEPVIILSATMQ